MSPEERLEHQRNAGLRRQQKRREQAPPKPRSGLRPTVTPQDLVDAVAEGLRATFAEVGLPNETDHRTRLLGLLVLLGTFPRQYRQSPEAARAALEAALPATDTETLEEAPPLGEWYKAARREWDELELRHSPLVGLFVPAYPRALIAPWESVEAVQRERPQPQRLEERPDVFRAADGTLARRRPGELPLLVPEDDGGLIRAPNVL